MPEVMTDSALIETARMAAPLFVALRSRVQIVAGQQDGIVDGRAELDAADDDEAEVHRALTVDVRKSGIDEDRALGSG